MNQNENTPENTGAEDVQGTGDLADTGAQETAQASADETEGGLKPKAYDPDTSNYEGWQVQYDAQLFDGSVSSKSYLRLAENEDIEIGVQPRLHRSGQNVVMFHGRLRVAYKTPLQAGKVANPDAESSHFKIENVAPAEPGARGVIEPGAVIEFPMLKPGARSERVARLLAMVPNAQFGCISPDRASLQFGMPMPFNVAQGAAFLTAIQTTGLCRDLLTLMVQPAGGWDPALLDSAAKALGDYFVICADQFGLFAEPVSPLPQVEVLPELVQGYLSKLGEKAASAAANPAAATL